MAKLGNAALVVLRRLQKGKLEDLRNRNLIAVGRISSSKVNLNQIQCANSVAISLSVTI